MKQLVAFLVICFGLGAADAQDAAAQKNLADIRCALDEQGRRIAELEGQNRRLMETVERLQAGGMTGTVSNPFAVARSPDVRVNSAPNGAAGIIAPLTDRGVRIKPYGYIKLDMIHNTSKTDGDDYAFYVRPPWAPGGNSSESTIALRESRLGMDMILSEPEDGINVSGKFEIDFYAGTVASPNLRIRHAYLNLERGNGWSMLAGQTHDAWWVLFPMLLDGGWGGATGHPYNRRPQLRLTKVNTFDDGSRLTVRMAAVQNAGLDLDNNLVDDGPASDWPMAQGAVILEKKLLTDKISTLSFSGSYGLEKIEEARSAIANGTYDTHLLMLNAALPLWSRFGLSSSFMIGRNMDTYKAGIFQGINMTRGTGIRSMGGWIQSNVDLTDKWRLYLGYAFEDANDADLEKRDRSFNSRCFISTYYILTPHVTLAGEYGHLETAFLDDLKALDDQYHFSMYYFF